jgi:hypothetical protein
LAVDRRGPRHDKDARTLADPTGLGPILAHRNDRRRGPTFILILSRRPMPLRHSLRLILTAGGLALVIAGPAQAKGEGKAGTYRQRAHVAAGGVAPAGRSR